VSIQVVRHMNPATNLGALDSDAQVEEEAERIMKELEAGEYGRRPMILHTNDFVLHTDSVYTE
jgi:hypothetical protein